MRLSPFRGGRPDGAAPRSRTIASARALRAALLSAAAIALAAGCGARPAGPVPSRAVSAVTGPAPKIEWATEDVGGRTARIVLSAPAADVSRVLPAAMDALGLRLTEAHPADGRYSSVGQMARRRLGAERLGTYLNCGQGIVGADNADTYDVRLVVHVRVEPVDTARTRSVLLTRFRASARPMNGLDDLVCDSRGTFESRLAVQVRELLGLRG